MRCISSSKIDYGICNSALIFTALMCSIATFALLFGIGSGIKKKNLVQKISEMKVASERH